MPFPACYIDVLHRLLPTRSRVQLTAMRSDSPPCGVGGGVEYVVCLSGRSRFRRFCRNASYTALLT